MTNTRFGVAMLLKQLFEFLTLAAAAAASCLPPYSADVSEVGCYTDGTVARGLTGAFLDFTSTNSPQICGNACGNAGWTYAGVEFA
jgi:beta-D-xylosidase 4